MGRAVFETLGLFLAPFALFAVYLVLRARFPLAMEHWTRGRVSLLTLAGLAAAVLGLVFLEPDRAARPRRLRPRPCRERRPRAGTFRVSALAGGRLRDMSLLREGPLADVMKLLNGDGEETRLVGGAVRDLALGAPPGDFDLATTAPPETVMARARAAGFHVVPTGLAHGTVTIIAAGLPIEVTTLRQDIATDGRHAEVAFGRDFRARCAAARFHHQRALDRPATAASTTMPAGSPISRRGASASSAMRTQRIREDYLRILRFFRFSARFGEGELDAEGFAATIAGTRGPGDSLARAGARGTVEAARRAARGRGRDQSMRGRAAGRAARRNGRSRATAAADRARGGARRAARPAAAAGGAGGLDRGGRRAPARTPAAVQRRIRSPRDAWRGRWKPCTARARRPRSAICACCCSNAAARARATRSR